MITTIIVIDDLEEAYKICKHLKQSRFESSEADFQLDLQGSRQIVQEIDEISGDTSKCQTFEDIQNLLSSRNAPENLILILDLGFILGDSFNNSIYENNFISTDIDRSLVKDDVLCGLLLGWKAIQNTRIKKLMIVYSTTRGADSSAKNDAYDFLCNKASSFCNINTKLTREITLYDKLGAPFVTSSPTNDKRIGHANKIIDNSIEQWIKLDDTNKESVLNPNYDTNNRGSAEVDEDESGIQNLTLYIPKEQKKAIDTVEEFPPGLIIYASRSGIISLAKISITTKITFWQTQILYRAYNNPRTEISFEEIRKISYDNNPPKDSKGTEKYVSEKIRAIHRRLVKEKIIKDKEIIFVCNPSRNSYSLNNEINFD